MNNKEKMTIRELAMRSGVSRHMIHYYIRRGILPPPEKINQTMAYYHENHLQTLRRIKTIKRGYKSPLAFALADWEGNRAEAGSPADTTLAGFRRQRQGVAGEEKKRKIIEAAIELFSTQGYHRTGIKEITDYLGISTGTFYLFFSSKTDLFNQAVAEAVRNTIDEMEEEIKDEEDFFQRNLIRVRILKKHYARFSEILTQLRAEAVNPESGIGAKLEEVYQEFSRPFVNEVKRAFKLGMIRPVDPELLTFCIIGMCDMMLLKNALDNKYDLEQIIFFMYDILLNGLKPEAGPSPSLPDLTPLAPQKKKGRKKTPA